MLHQLSNIQFAILDKLYFVENLDTIVEETGYSYALVTDELKTLIANKLVQVMVFNNELNDYVKSEIYDVDNFRAFYFLATKEGLMAHNGRSM